MKKYKAKDGMVFDYKEPLIDEDGTVQHLYGRTLYLPDSDSIENYIEIEAPADENQESVQNS